MRHEANRTHLWSFGAFALLLGPFAYWFGSGPPDLRIPPTPVHRLNLTYSQQLVLLAHAREWIPAGASYTTVAADPDAEMSLFMFSLSELPGRRPEPTTYYGKEALHGDKARFVIAYRCQVREEGLRLLAQFLEGCIYERAWGTQ